MSSKKKMRRAGRMIDKGFGLLDAFLKGAAKAKPRRKQGTGTLSGGMIKPPAPGCGKCD